MWEKPGVMFWPLFLGFTKLLKCRLARSSGIFKYAILGGVFLFSFSLLFFPQVTPICLLHDRGEIMRVAMPFSLMQVPSNIIHPKEGILRREDCTIREIPILWMQLSSCIAFLKRQYSTERGGSNNRDLRRFRASTIKHNTHKERHTTERRLHEGRHPCYIDVSISMHSISKKVVHRGEKWN